MSCAGNHDESRTCDHDAAFRDYVLTKGTALLRMAIMLTGNRADAEDLVQAALAKTYLAWGKINDHAALDAYVRRAMVSTTYRGGAAVGSRNSPPMNYLIRSWPTTHGKATWPKWSGGRSTGCRSGCGPPSCSGTSRT